MTRSKLLLTALVPMLALGACAAYDDEGKWRPTRANDANLAMMVENPRDLIRGRGARGSLGYTAADAVNRYETDSVRRLPDTSLADLARRQQSASGGANQ
ncbi:MAG: hypothetical protein IT557_07320 [Alphaproteobacteria bacterium]|nr:hypothetical protein [Alphaproteobacteria bacterium]